MRLDKLQAGSAYPAPHGWSLTARQEIDEHLEAMLEHGQSSRVHEAMRYAVLGAGKRIRPLLTLAVADFLGGRPPGLMHAACAIEMIHAASLVLDDLPCMDNDRLRRDRPATHAVFGDDCAILAAVSLLMRSHCMLASHPDVPADVRLRTIQLLCETIGADGLSLGQYIDLASKSAPASPGAIAGIHHLKTGILFLAAARAACLLCGATPRQEQGIVAFTTHVGLAFQLKDDLADVDAPGLNLVASIGVHGARQQFHEHLQEAQAAIDGEDNAEVLLGFAAMMCGTG